MAANPDFYMGIKVCSISTIGISFASDIQGVKDLISLK
jgi:hypothetical protein